jgi:hypothetical protein
VRTDAGPAGQHFRLPGFAEALAWTGDGLLVLAAEQGADAASLTSGRPLSGTTGLRGQPGA